MKEEDQFFKNGDVINSRYEVIKLLGHGGMGFVYMVKDYVDNRVIALKLIRNKIFSDKAIIRFKTEFDLVIHLDHPNIIKVYNFETEKKYDTYFITMEYIKGLTLTEAYGSMTDTEKYKVLLQIVRGLNYIHSRNILHFDIKPDNIFLIPKDNGEFTVKIMDFGLASLIQDFTGKIRGTLSYIAPEVMMKQNVDFRLDLYSLGMVIYHIFSNKLPFEDYSTVKAIAEAKKTEAFFYEDAYKSLKSNFLRNLIANLCRFNKEERIGSAQHLMEYIETALEMNLRKDENAISSSLNDVYFDNKDYLPTLQNEYLNFCLRGEKRSGKLTIVVGEKGVGKSYFLKNFNIKAQLNRVPTLYIDVKKEKGTVNLFFRKLMFGLISYTEKNSYTKDFFIKAQRLLDHNGNFRNTLSIGSDLKELFKDILTNLTTVYSLVVMVDGVENFTEREKDIFKYILHAIVTSPIFLIITVDKDNVDRTELINYEQIFYMFPPELIEIENLTQIESLHYISKLLNVSTEKIDEELLSKMMLESSGNIYLIKQYILFLLENNFLIKREGHYVYNYYLNIKYENQIEKIYTQRLLSLNGNEKYFLLYLIDEHDYNENLNEIASILEFKFELLEQIIKKLTELHIIDFKLDRGKRKYFIKNESLKDLVKSIYDAADYQLFYDKLSKYYSEKKEKSIVKFSYCYIRSSANEDDKKEVLTNVINYCKLNFKEIYLKDFLLFYYNNFKLLPKENVRILKELYTLLLWAEEFSESYFYFKQLFSILNESENNIEYAELLVDSACFSNKEVAFTAKIKNLVKAIELFFLNKQYFKYFNTVKTLVLMLVRTGQMDKAYNYTQNQLKIKKDLLPNNIKIKLEALIWMLLADKNTRNSTIYKELVEMNKNIDIDFIAANEDNGIVEISIINYLIKGHFDIALYLCKAYLIKMKDKHDSSTGIFLNYIYAYLLKKKGELSEALSVYLKIETLFEGRKGVVGLVFVLIDKIKTMILLRKDIQIIYNEFGRTISIAEKLEKNRALLVLNIMKIKFLMSIGDWRNIDIIINASFNLIKEVPNIEILKSFFEVAGSYYYVIKDPESFFELERKLRENSTSEIDEKSIIAFMDSITLLFTLGTRENLAMLLKKIAATESKYIRYLYLIKYINNGWNNYYDINLKQTLEIVFDLKRQFVDSPFIFEYLEIIKNCLNSNTEAVAKMTASYVKKYYPKGYLFDCYFPIMSAMYFFKNKAMYKKNMYFEAKHNKLTKKLSLHLQFEKQENFVEKYWVY